MSIRLVGRERLIAPRKNAANVFAPERRLVGYQEAGHQAADLVAREYDVTNEETEGAGRGRHHGRRYAQDRRVRVDGGADERNEVAERHRLGSGCVDHDVARRVAGIGADPGEILDVHRLDGVGAVAGQRERRHSTQDPSDVVGEHVALTAEDPGWPHDRVRHAGLGERVFDERLAAEVGKRGFQRRVGDAEVHDPLDSGTFGGEEQHPGALDRVREARLPVIEADPEGVVERGHPLQAASERRRVVEPVLDVHRRWLATGVDGRGGRSASAPRVRNRAAARRSALRSS